MGSNLDDAHNNDTNDDNTFDNNPPCAYDGMDVQSEQP